MLRRLALALLFVSACSSSSDTTLSVTYPPLGSFRINKITGSALNGDPFARAEDGNPVRWRAATSTWEPIGTPRPNMKKAQFSALTEDAAGTIYSDIEELTAGSNDWVHATIPGQSFGALQRPWGNAKGDIARQGTIADKNQIYRKLAGSSTFTVSERPLDGMQVIGLSESGDVFLGMVGGDPRPTPFVLPTGKSEIVPVLDCTGTTINEACGHGVLVSPHGDVLLYGGGLATRHMYLVPATTTYPATAKLLFDFPDGACCFNGGQAFLADGTLLARMNDGADGDTFLYVHKPGASAWSEPVTLPGDDHLHSVDIFATVTGTVFTNYIALGDVFGGGPAYRVSY